MLRDKILQFLVSIGAEMPPATTDDINAPTPFYLHIASERRFCMVEAVPDESSFFEFSFFLDEDAEDYIKRLIPHFRTGLNFFGTLGPMNGQLFYCFEQAFTEHDYEQLLQLTIARAERDMRRIESRIRRPVPEGAEPSWVGVEVGHA